MTVFLDANSFLRYLVAPDSPANVTMNEAAAVLFDAIERGEVEATTSQAVLAEVAFVLTSRRLYGLSPQRAAELLAAILRLPGLKLPRGDKRLYLDALRLWSMRPTLGFVDALTAVMVEHGEFLLATFDRDFVALPGVTLWSSATISGQDTSGS